MENEIINMLFPHSLVECQSKVYLAGLLGVKIHHIFSWRIDGVYSYGIEKAYNEWDRSRVDANDLRIRNVNNMECYKPEDISVEDWYKVLGIAAYMKKNTMSNRGNIYNFLCKCKINCNDVAFDLAWKTLERYKI